MNSVENRALVFARSYLSEQPGMHYWVSLDVVREYYLDGDQRLLPEAQWPYSGAEYDHAHRVLNKLEGVYYVRSSDSDLGT